MTLDQDNLLWLRGRAASRKRKSLSDALDEILTATRLGGLASDTSRSVLGTVDIAVDDPGLDNADLYLREMFSTSLTRPAGVHERPPTYARGKTPAVKKQKPRGRG